MIRITAIQVWGNKVEFGEIKVLNSPYPEFEWVMRIYGVDILLKYDRSALDIGVPQNDQYVLMSEFTNESFVRGMKSTEVNNLLHNFQVLDRLLKKQIK